jgi:hypothetical protein
MGLFDAFTGDAAKEAADKNRALLAANQTAGTNTLQTGQTSALGALDSAAGAYTPLSALGTKYGAATTMGLNALGVNGAAGNQAATDAFHAGPGYQYSVDQSLDGINRHAAATGVAAGGNTLAALSDRAGSMADQEYNNWVSNLNGYVSPELSATSGAASGIAGADTNKAGVYSNTANQIAGLGTTTTNGIAGQNTQEANAVTAASGNMWNLGLQAATALATGGTSLLGSAGSQLGALGTNMANNGGKFNPIAGMTG